MERQIIPTEPVTEEQLSGWLRFTKDCIRNGGLDMVTFQHILERQELVELLGDLFNRVVNEYQQSLPLIERSIWKTIKLGTHPSVDALHAAMIDADVDVRDSARDILDKVEVVTEPQEIDLIVATVAELGFPGGATHKQACEKALALGLELCPAEVGPQLRLQYPDQPIESVNIAMEPLTRFGSPPSVFRVWHNWDGLCLDGDSYDGTRRGDFRWVFCRE